MLFSMIFHFYLYYKKCEPSFVTKIKNVNDEFYGTKNIVGKKNSHFVAPVTFSLICYIFFYRFRDKKCFLNFVTRLQMVMENFTRTKNRGGKQKDSCFVVSITFCIIILGIKKC